MKMKAIAVGIGLAVMPLVHAEGASLHSDCSEISRVAEDIAVVRYEGIAMRHLMGAYQDNEIMRPLIQLAYKLPAYGSKSMQAHAAREFGDRIYQGCIENVDTEVD